MTASSCSCRRCPRRPSSPRRPENPDLTWALYGDRLLFDGTVGTLQRKVVRSGVVDDVRKRLAEVAAKHRSP